MKAGLKKRLMGLLLAVAVTVPNTGISFAAPLEINVTEDEVTTDGALSVGEEKEDIADEVIFEEDAVHDTEVSAYDNDGDRATSEGAVTAMATGEFSYAVEGGNIYYDSTGTITDCDYTVTSAVIPSVIDGVEITSIGDYAFRNNNNLTSITIPEGVTSIGDYVLRDCSILTDIHVDDNNTAYQSIDGVLFTKNGTTLVACPSGKTGEYTIPKGVTGIDKGAFEGCSNLTSITIPAGVTSIEEYTFRDCSNLTRITIPEGVTSIGNSAFVHCSSLTSATIPEGVTSIGDNAFYGCSSLTSITIPAGVTSIGNSAFGYCSSLIGINVNANNTAYQSIDGVLFTKNCNTLIVCPIGKMGEYTIPKGVTSIKTGAFGFCSSLTSITIPEGVTSIDNATFNGCSSLTSITIPNGVTWIGDSAFSGCSSLISITIPEGVTNIGTWAFQNCSSLISITIPKGVTRIRDNAFSGCNNVENLVLGVNDNPVPSNKLKTVKILDGVTSIGNSAFSDCSNLTSITIPKGVTSIGGWAFCNCSSLTSIAMPEGVTSLNNYAFEDCSSLTSITIPKSVTSIGYKTFADCSNLTSITIPEGVTSIDNLAFENCSSLTSINVDANNTVYQSIDGVLFTKNGTTLVACPDGKAGEYTIPKGVTSIDKYAFWGCSNLTSITIPEGVTSIQEYTFHGCRRLTSITIPEGVTSIQAYSFRSCSSLAGITIPEGVRWIGNDAFEGCISLTGIVIPSSVVSIDFPFGNESAGKLIFYVESGSYAERYARERGYKVAYEIPDNFGVPLYDTTILPQNMNIGDSVTLNAYSKKGDSSEPFAINWTNSAPEVINLIPDTGVTTSYDRYYYKAKAVAIGEGTATITAEASNGSVLTYTFNVVKKPIKIEKLTVNGGSSLDISKDYSDIDIRLTFTEDVVLNKEGVAGNSFVLKDSETATDVIASQMISGDNVTQVDSRTIRVVFPDTQLSGSGLSRKYLDILFSDAITHASTDHSFDQEEVFPVSFALTDGTYKYGVSVSTTTDFRTAAQQYMTALEAYEKSVRSGLAKEYPEVDLTGYTQMIPTLDSLLVGEENIPAEAKEACRRALFEALKNINNSNLEIKDKYSSDKEQFTLNILNEVIKKLNNVSYVFDDAGYEYRATAHLTGIGREFFGEVTYEKKNTQNGNVTGTIGVSKDPDMVADAIATYATDLCELGNTAVNNFVCTVFDEYSKVFGLDKYLEDKLTFDINSVPEEFTELAKIYNDSSDICNAIEGVINSATPADTYFTAQELHDIAMNGNVFEKPAQCSFNAYTQLKKARDVLIECANYYIAHNEMPEIPVSTVTNWLKKLVFNCPVDLYVYGEDGSLLGYISGDEVVVQSDAIALEKNRDQKILYLLTHEPVTYRLSAYDYGMLNITEETMSDGEIIARSNYYDIPLDVNDELISNEISPDREKHSLMTKDGVITSDTDLLVSDDAAVNISVQGENGRVSGGGTYVAGDRVTLMASPEEGYSFGGWYEGDTLVSIQNMYAFVARKDISLRAEFNEIVLLEYLYGDANADGLITASDCAAVLQKVLDASFVTGIEASGGDYMTYLDVSDDNKLTAADASIILQKTLDNSFKMPCEG